MTLADFLGRIAADDALASDFAAICDTGGRLQGTPSAERGFALVEERLSVFGTVVRQVAGARRKVARRREAGDLVLGELSAPAEGRPDAALERERARALLDDVIAALPEDTRPVFVLYELENMTMAEIATCLELAPGTVASRRRRGREAFAASVARLQARSASKESAR